MPAVHSAVNMNVCTSFMEDFWRLMAKDMLVKMDEMEQVVRACVEKYK